MKNYTDRVWPKVEIEVAFQNYLIEIKLVESCEWSDLSTAERSALTKFHFEMFWRELKSFRPKQKAVTVKASQ